VLKAGHGAGRKLTVDAVGGRQEQLVDDEGQFRVFDDEDTLAVRVQTGATGPADHLLVTRSRQPRRAHVGRAQDHLRWKRFHFKQGLN